jgi:hypothetical protein
MQDLVSYTTATGAAAAAAMLDAFAAVQQVLVACMNVFLSLD